MNDMIKTKLRLGLCRFGGYAFFGLGLAGAFLPLLPTTIFWILAAWLFTHAHPEMKQRIYAWPHFGPIVENLLENGMLSARSKHIATIGITLVGGSSIMFSPISGSWMLAIAITLFAVIIYIQTRPEA